MARGFNLSAVLRQNLSKTSQNPYYSQCPVLDFDTWNDKKTETENLVCSVRG